MCKGLNIITRTILDMTLLEKNIIKCTVCTLVIISIMNVVLEVLRVCRLRSTLSYDEVGFLAVGQLFGDWCISLWHLNMSSIIRSWYIFFTLPTFKFWDFGFANISLLFQITQDSKKLNILLSPWFLATFKNIFLNDEKLFPPTFLFMFSRMFFKNESVLFVN